MNPLWRGGQRTERSNPPARKVAVVAGVLIVGGLGWLYGSTLAELLSLRVEVAALHKRESELAHTRDHLQDKLESAEEPEVVEEMARQVLGWGYEDEELVILVED